MDSFYDAAFFVVGVLLVAFVLWRQPKWDPVNIDRSNFKLRVPSVVFLVLIGVAVASVTVYFRHERFEEAKRRTAEELTSTRARVKLLEDQVEEHERRYRRLSTLELVVELKFPPDVPTSKLVFQGLVRSPGEPAPDIRQVDLVSSDQGVVKLRVSGLSPGDQVGFAARRGQELWSSEQFEVPAIGRLDMRKVQ